MHPVLISFHFPEAVGAPAWLEILLTAVVIAALVVWRLRSERFKPVSFAVWLLIYVVLRGLVWHAGPGYHFKLHTYGVLIAVGFVVGIWLAVRQAKKEFIDPNVILDLAFWILIASMVGSRLLFIIVNIEDYVAHPINLIKIWQGGLVFYGGFIGAVAAAWYYCSRRGISFLRIADIVIPSVAIGHFFGRLGCFSAGCCHGVPTGSDSFGTVFTAAGTVVARNNMLGLPLHPTQLYESLGELLVFIALVLTRSRKRINGQLLNLWLLTYPIWRFLTEMFRGDRDRGLLFEVDLFGDGRAEIFSTSQLVSVGLFGLGVALFLYLRKKGNSAVDVDVDVDVDDVQ